MVQRQKRRKLLAALLLLMLAVVDLHVIWKSNCSHIGVLVSGVMATFMDRFKMNLQLWHVQATLLLNPPARENIVR